MFKINSFRMAVARGVVSFNIGKKQSSPEFVALPKKLFSSSTTSSSSSKKDNIVYSHHRQCHNSETRSSEEKKITLSDDDFDEKFVRGSGPGGQKINKTSNCVELKHKSTGVVVKCQETRSLEKNREIARGRLLEKLKFMFTPKDSFIQKKVDEKKKRKSDAQRKRHVKEEAINNRVDI